MKTYSQINYKNTYKIIELDGSEYVEFITNGKHNYPILVNVDSWFNYLYQYNWTGQINYEKFYAKTSINGLSKQLHRIIAEREIDELDLFGRSIDHINGDTKDNRSINLRCVSQVTNMSNLNSTSNIEKCIYKSGNGFKVHMNICNTPYHKYFKTVEECVEYRDNVLIPLKEKEIAIQIKKERDIEFERGLKTKLENGELNEILSVLKKYKIIIHNK